MLTGMEKMKCGGCGDNNFQIYAPPLRESWLLVECNKCKSSSIITIKSAEIIIEWGNNSTGILTT